MAAADGEFPNADSKVKILHVAEGIVLANPG